MAEAPASRLSRLEIWTGFECAAGTRVGFFVPLPSSAVHAREVNGDDRLRLQVYRDVDAWAYVQQDRVARAVLTDGTYRELRIADIGQAHEADGRLVAELVCEASLYDLGLDRVAHVLVTGEVLHDFPLPYLTPAEHLSVILGKTAGFTSGAAAWWSVGTVDFTARVDVNYRAYSPLEAIHELRRVLAEAGQKAEIEVLRVGTTGYSMGLRSAVGSSAPRGYLRYDRNVHTLRQTEVAQDLPTRVYPLGQDQEGVRFGIGDAAWEVASVSGNDVVLLEDPVGFDDQFNTLYVERPDGVRIQISDTVKATQKLVLASTPGLSPGDLVRIRKNSSGHQLTYLDRPGAALVRSEPIERPDIPGVDNLAPNPFLTSWSAGLPVGFAKVGTPTVTEISEGGKVLNGTRSAEIVSLSEEEGLETDWIDVSPTARRPHFLGQVALYPIEGVWRFEMLGDDGTPEGVLIPDGVGEGARAYTSVEGQWVVRLSVQDQAVNFTELGITQVKLRLIADRLHQGTGQASCYLDAVQLVQTPLPDMPFYGGWASRALWRAGNERLAAVADGAFRLEVSITDLYRLDRTAFPHDELVLGGTVEVQDPKLQLVAETRIRKISEELVQPGATQVELSDEPDVLVDLLTDRLPAGRGSGPSMPPGATGAVDGQPLLDEDYAELFLHPNRFAGAKSIRYVVSDEEIDEADVLSSVSTSNSADAILLHTFTEDREKRWVGVAYYPGRDGAGKVGGVHILTPWTFYTKDNRPFIAWQTFPGPKPSLTRIGLTVVDDGDQVAGYTRSWTDGDSPPAFTRNPVGTGFVTDPHGFSVDVAKPAADEDPDTIFEAYAEDDQENTSYTLRLRVRHSMVEEDEPRVFARLDEDDGDLYLVWDPANPYSVNRLQHLLDEVDSPLEAEVEASEDFDATGHVLVHQFDPNGPKTQIVYLGYIPQSADSGGRDVGPMRVIPYTYRVGNDRPTVDVEYQGRGAGGLELWRAVVLDDGDDVALFLRTYDKETTPPAYTRFPESGYGSDPLVHPFSFAHPEDGDPNVVIEAYAEDADGLVSDPVYKESDSDTEPRVAVVLDVDPVDNEAYYTVVAVDTDARSWRLRFAKGAEALPAFTDEADDEISGTVLGVRTKVSSLLAGLGKMADDEVLYAAGYGFNTASTGAAAQEAAPRSEVMRDNTGPAVQKVLLKGAWLDADARPVPTTGLRYLTVRFNWQAVVGDVGSIYVEWDGPATGNYTINVSVHAGYITVAGAATIIDGFNAPTGEYTFTATPYPEVDAGGTPGAPVSGSLLVALPVAVIKDGSDEAGEGSRIVLGDGLKRGSGSKLELDLTVGTDAVGELAPGELYGRYAAE